MIFTFNVDSTAHRREKYIIIAFIVPHFLAYAALGGCIFTTMKDNESLRMFIVQESGDVLVPYFNEVTFMYVGELGGITRKVCAFFAILFIILILVLLGCILYFTKSVFFQKQTSTILTKTAKSLIVSSIVQGIVCCTFTFIPFGSLLFIWAFKIENSANFINHACIVSTLHGVVDMLCTLYFVKPYRRYCCNIILRLKRRYLKETNVHVQIGTSMT
uniref:Serpentine Receptor, class T n=1 Tax=Panagrellus redivivus TaxID=6233 RepID=A0A7E4VMF0_PANRE